jgi:Lon protease-like protein
MSDYSALPLFPLKMVLFPGQFIPLHIFEPRYRLMVNQCLEKEVPFGAVLIRQGSEVGAAAEPFRVGTTVRIRKTDRLEDGRINILGLGEQRFILHATSEEQPYLTGAADLWPWPGMAQGQPGPDVFTLRRRLIRYLRQAAKPEVDKVDLEELPHDPVLLSSLAAIALKLPLLEKQQLLEAPALVDLITLELSILRRENRAMQIAPSIPDEEDISYLTYYSDN